MEKNIPKNFKFIPISDENFATPTPTPTLTPTDSKFKFVPISDKNFETTTPEPLPKEPGFFSDQNVGGIAKNTITGIPKAGLDLFKKGFKITKDVVKASPGIAKNIVETGTTKEGRGAVAETFKEVGIPSLKNIIYNYNELFCEQKRK